MKLSDLFVLKIFSRIIKLKSDVSTSSDIRICTKRLDCSTAKKQK